MTDPLEEAIEEYLIAIASDPGVSWDTYLERLNSAVDRNRFMVIVLAERFLAEKNRGEEPDLELLLSQLPDDASRMELEKYLGHSVQQGSLRPKPLGVGTILADRYRIEGVHASGGTAIIYLAHDMEFDVERSIKAFNQKSNAACQAEDWEQLVLSEARTLAQLESRNIVKVHDIVRDGDRSYIVMDFVRGRDLEQVLEAVRGKVALAGSAKKTPSWLSDAIGAPMTGQYEDLLGGKDWYHCIARIIHRAVRALELAHAQGVRHRDLKPANLLIVGGGEPVLLDFGFGSSSGTPAHLVDRITGTPEYMAPEQFTGKHSLSDPRVDIYQLGVVLYEFLTLERPFARQSPGFLEEKRKGNQPRPRSIDPAIPSALEAICEMATAAEMDLRYATATELRVDLERFLDGKPPRHATIGAAAQLTGWTKWVLRRPTTVVGLLAVTVLAVVLQFRGEAWYPPVLEAQVAMGGDRPVPLGSESDLTWSGERISLGFNMEATHPSVLYAFEIYGDDEKQRFIRPLSWLNQSRARELAGRAGDAVLHLDGTQRYLHEEIFVIAAEESLAAVELYMEQLEQERGTFESNVLLDAGQFTDLVKNASRGVSNQELSPESRAALADVFSRSAEKSDDEWAAAGMKSYHFTFQVRYEEESE